MMTPASAPAMAEGAAAPLRTDSARGRLVDEAYNEFLRRIAAGEPLDFATFCAEYPASIGPELIGILEAQEFLNGELELLDDAPSRAQSLFHQSGISNSAASKPPIAWPEVGATWEGFRLLAELGRGSFARVYLARELALGERLVALKCTTLGAGEAAMLGRLDHPHVVPIHSIRELPERRLTLVCMPYLGHATLGQVCLALHGRPQPIARATALLDACWDARLPNPTPAPMLRRGSYLDGVRWLAGKIAAALAYLHAHGVCHRDLKPSNILLQPDGAPRLLDFNLSADALLPQTYVGGTPHYMAPEQLLAMASQDVRALTPQIDVYALGVILYEWLTGKHPYAPLPDERPNEALQRHIRDCQRAGLPALAPLARQDRALAHLIERCLAYRPEDRPSAAELERLLLGQLRLPQRWRRTLAGAPLRTAAAALILGATVTLAAYHVSTRPPREIVDYQQGVEAHRVGDYREAVRLFNQALAAPGPGRTESLLARARAYQRLGEDKKEFFSLAIADYQQIHELGPRGECSAGMAYCAQRLQQLDTAVHYYQLALAQGYATPAVHHNLACIYADQGKQQDAQREIENALALDDKLPAPHLLFAKVLVQQVLANPRRAADGPMPDMLSQALVRLERALPRLQAASAPQALFAAHIHAVASSYDAAHREPTLRFLERAVDSGADPDRIRLDPRFRSFQGEARFVALTQRPASNVVPPTWHLAMDILTY